MNIITSTKNLKNISYVNIMIGIFILSVSLYLYLAFYTAYLVATIDNTENTIKDMQGELAILEKKYIDSTKDLDILFAYEEGYEDNALETVYITRKSRTALIEN